MWCATTATILILVVRGRQGHRDLLGHRQRHRGTEHGFWLSDAFASGGSAGYDHKKMASRRAAPGNQSSGISARWTWTSARRLFTVAGVGDMSGDVFGNGMLRERTIRLVAAFDHRDIFIDPVPDPEKSLAERQRLFDLPRSSWQDYNRALISPGGGVFSRSLKEIKLSPQAQKLIGLDGATTNPQQLMNAILKMPTDLLWFGGIGTYVRASSETMMPPAIAPTIRSA